MHESGGEPEDLSQGQLPQLRELFEDESGLGLWMFGFHICGLTRLTLHLHLEIAQFLSMWGRTQLSTGEWIRRPLTEGETALDTYRRLMMIVPRGAYKTSLGTKCLALWTVTKDAENTVGIFNAAEVQAKSWIGSIRQIMETSKLYHTLWPERLPPGVHYRDTRSIPRSWKWGDTGIVLPRVSTAVSELTIEPYGIGGASTGKHYTHRIMDDLVGETSATSQAIMQDAIHFVDHARALERPPDSGCELVNCTRWAYFDVYAHMLQKWNTDYKVYRRSLLEHPETREPDVINGRSIFPEEFPTALCKKMYGEDPFVFNSQRQCTPQAGRDTAFDPSWIRHFGLYGDPEEDAQLVIAREHYDPNFHVADVGGPAPRTVQLSWLDRAIIVDPAPPPNTSESRAQPGSRNGINVVGMDPWGRRFTLESVPLREDPVAVLERILLLAQRWQTDRCGVEEVNFSKVYAPLWNEILRARYPGLTFYFLPLKTKNQDKDFRIRSMVAPHREGLWYHNLSGCEYLLQELAEFPSGQTRDLIDSLAYTDRILQRPPTIEEQWKRRQRRLVDDTQREPYTNY